MENRGPLKGAPILWEIGAPFKGPYFLVYIYIYTHMICFIFVFSCIIAPIADQNSGFVLLVLLLLPTVFVYFACVLLWVS